MEITTSNSDEAFFSRFLDNLMNVYGFLVSLSFLVISSLYVYLRCVHAPYARLLNNMNLLSPEESFPSYMRWIFYYLSTAVCVFLREVLLHFFFRFFLFSLFCSANDFTVDMHRKSTTQHRTLCWDTHSLTMLRTRNFYLINCLCTKRVILYSNSDTLSLVHSLVLCV